MKIAIITDDLSLGGAERQIVFSASELVRHGEHVEVIRYHEKNDFDEFLRVAKIKDVYISALGLFRLGRIISIACYLRRGRFDVVHAFKGIPSIYGQIAAKLAGVKCFFAGYRGQASLPTKYRWLIQIFCSNPAGWIVNSEGVKRTVHLDFKVSYEKIFVVRNIINKDEFQSNLTVKEAKESFGISHQVHTIAFIANFRPVKNPEMFFRVAERIVRSGRNVHLLVAGHIPQKKQIEELCQELGVDNHIRFLGIHKDLATLLRATDVLLLTSHREGLPNVLIEAGAAGVPCVSTDNGAREVLVEGTTGYIVPPDDDEAMAERVFQLLDDPGTRRQMGANAARRITTAYSPENFYRSLVNVYCKGLEYAGRAIPSCKESGSSVKENSVPKQGGSSE